MTQEDNSNNGVIKEDCASWSMDLVNQLKELQQKVQAFELVQQRIPLQEKLLLKLLEKKIPASFARSKVVECEKDIETVFTQIEKEFLAQNGNNDND